MKHKKILLVANDNLEILNVQRELTKHHVDHSLHIAKNGLDALALLMGCSSPQLENYSKTGKVQPDIILMDAESPNLNMIELLCIMQKYYSLQKIRVYLMVTHPDKIDLPECEKYGIAGVVAKPFNMESTLFDAKKLMAELGKSPQKAWIPFISLLPFEPSFSKCLSIASKIKSSALHFTGALAAKTGIVGVVVAGGAIIGSSLAKSDNNVQIYETPVLNTTKVQAVQRAPAISNEIENVITDTQPQFTKPAARPQIRQKKETKLSNISKVQPAAEEKTDRNFRIVVTEVE
jgi:CheY-like chemotaxis protein